MKGVVLKSTGSWYTVQNEDKQEIMCRVKGKLRLQDTKTTNPIAVGDLVQFDLETGLNTAVIQEVLPRKNFLIRQSPHNRNLKHIIAANIDQAVLIVTLSHPRTSTGFIDRFLLMSQLYHIPAVLVFNKFDLYTPESLTYFEELKNTYENLQYTVLLTSAANQYGLISLKKTLQNKTSLISGHSGVGKSTLINCLEPTLKLATDNISDYSEKGKHTTTFATMFELSMGGYIIDTPGIKELGTVTIEPEEVSHYFLEMDAIRQHCQFNNCLHENEPNCAVKQAVSAGKIAAFRFDSYLSILYERRGINYWERH